MNRNKRGMEFWMLLGAGNLLALIYPIHRLIHASSVDEDLFATCILVGSLFLLLVLDAVSIVVAGTVGPRKH